MTEITQGELLFSEFLAPRKILIADPNGSSRASLAKLMVGLGAKTNHLQLVGDFESAMSDIAARQPKIVITEFMLGKKTGFDLTGAMRTAGISVEDSFFVIVTGNNSQSAIAQAAEEDVDAFILKPYTVDSFKKLIVTVALAKIYPNDYTKLIQQGKNKLNAGQADQAIAIFNEATKKDSKPALALFYLAQAEIFKKMVDSAEKTYSEGLKYNDVHYKCMTGLFDLLMERNRTVDAYAVVKKIAKFFPANPKRMGQVLRLAIATSNYSDVEDFYEIFKNLDDRDSDMVRYISAALVVCGKHFCREGNVEKGSDFFEKASVSCAGRVSVLREVIQDFLMYGLIDRARASLKRIDPSDHGSPDYKICQLGIDSATGGAADQILLRARALLKDTQKDQWLYELAIRAAHTLNRTEETEDLLSEALANFPASAQLLKDLVHVTA